MRTLIAVAFSLTLAGAAVAQDQTSDDTRPAQPSQAISKPQQPAPPISMPRAAATSPIMGNAPANAAMPSAGAAAASSLKLVDAAIKDLEQSVSAFKDCISGLDYLRKDLAATKARAQARGGGAIPSDQAGLIVLKTKRLGSQQQSCIAQTKLLDDHFTMAVRGLAGIQPPSHAGIPPRRQKILQLRERFNAEVKKLGGKAPVKGAPSGDDESDQQ